jgi:hypothetical protein
MRCKGRACGKDGAAEVERVARVRVRAADRQNFLFVQIAGRVTAHEQPQCTNCSAHQDASRRGLRQQ